MNIYKRGMIFVTFFGCCMAIGLCAAALGTKYWFSANARQKLSNTILEENKQMANGKKYRENATGTINFGLFKGRRNLNAGFGIRKHDIDIFDANDEVNMAGLMDYGLWITTIVCLCIAMLFSVLGALFAVVNTATTPIDSIFGVFGLYVWNGAAALFDLICISCWGAQYSSHLTKNALVRFDELGWTTEGMETLGYSYWLVFVAMLIQIGNCCIIFFGTYERKVKTTTTAPDQKSSPNIMLY